MVHVEEKFQYFRRGCFFPRAHGYHHRFQALQYINHLDCGRPQVTVPEWHKVPGTTFIVDKFGRGIESSVECKSWFLTHFHADHYGGLNGRFKSGVARSAKTCTLGSVDVHRPASCPSFDWCSLSSNCLFCTACLCAVPLSYPVLVRWLLAAQPILFCLSAGLVYCTQITAKLANARLNVSCILLAEALL